MFDFNAIAEVRLERGSHKAPSDGLCVMEMVAWFAGESHSDHPACVCPALAHWARVLNDTLDDQVRDRLLKPLVPLLAGTRGRDDVASERYSVMTSRWIEQVLPMILRRADIKPLDRLAAAIEQPRPWSDGTYRSLNAWGLLAVAEPRRLVDLEAAISLVRLKYKVAIDDTIAAALVDLLKVAILAGPHEGFDAVDKLAPLADRLRQLAAA